MLKKWGILMWLVVYMGVFLMQADLEAQETVASWETIEKKSYSSHPEREQYAIRNEEEWETLWNRVYKGRSPIPERPDVDFAKEMVIAVFMGEKPTGGYSIEIERIVEREETWEVHVQETAPGPNDGVIEALTQPYHMVRTPRTEKEVTFVGE